MEIEDWRTSDSRVLYLGLGGTGKEIVARVKAQLKALGGGEVSPNVGFLVIDVDPGAPKAPDLRSVLSPTEMCHPAQGQLPSFVLKEIRRHSELETELKWVGERIPPGEMILLYNNFIRGTERYRQAGLLAYLWEEHSAGVTTPLRNALAKVTANARGPVSLQVFLICSICGGAGSGMLIDVAYLARSLGLDYSATSCDVSAVIVLPGVFRRVVDDATYDDLQRNALATLTELDYFMYPRDQRGPRTCNPNDVYWPLRSAARVGQFLDTQEAIFQSVFLIDNERNNGGTLGGTETVFPAVADMLVHLFGDLIGDRVPENLYNAKGTLTRRFALDQLGKDIPHCSSLGLAHIVLPVRRMAIEAAAVLSGDVLTKLRGGAEKPSEAAVADAVRRLELEPAAMALALGLARDELIAGLAKAIDLRAPGAASGRIAVVSQRVAELVRQKAPPDAIRLYCLDTLGKARRSVTAAQDQAQRRLSARLAGSAETMNKVLNERLTQMRETGRGLAWFLSLLGKVIEATDMNLALARQASARERSDAAAQAEQELQKACDRLGNCPPSGVRQAALAAAAMGDGWLGKRVDLVTAQMQDLVFDDSLTRLRKIAEAAQSLDTLLGETLPAETDRAVGALCKKEKDEALETDIRVPADGRKEYESAKSCAVREKMTADCLKDMTFEVLGGEQDYCMRLRCAGDWLGDGSLLIGPPLQPFEATRNWIEYLAGRLKPFFAAQRLDDYITTDEEAGRYANACAKAAEVFVKYNPTMQLSEAGDPITITVAVAPANSRLDAAFSRPDTAWRGQFQGLVRAQDSDPTTALVLKAEIGILGKALQFRKDAAALEASMVSMKGLWTLGQLSHDLFWQNGERWSSLGLFFQAWAESLVIRQEIPPRLRGPEATRHEYWLDSGQDRMVKLGQGLQASVLRFVEPTYADYAGHRERLRRELPAPTGQGSVMGKLLPVASSFLEIIEDPDEVPSVALRKVLSLRLKTLTDGAPATESADSAAAGPSGRHS